jgi:hypothetical protein
MKGKIHSPRSEVNFLVMGPNESDSTIGFVGLHAIVPSQSHKTMSICVNINSLSLKNVPTNLEETGKEYVGSSGGKQYFIIWSLMVTYLQK